MNTFHALSFAFGAIVSAVIIFSYLYGKQNGQKEVEREWESD